MDEASFHTWMRQDKAWQRVDLPRLKTIVNPHRPDNLTVIGAITNKERPLMYHIAPKTKKEYVVEFLQKYKKEFSEMIQPVMVLDNHKSHKSNMVFEALEELGIDPLFLLVNSSFLSP